MFQPNVAPWQQQQQAPPHHQQQPPQQQQQQVQQHHLQQHVQPQYAPQVDGKWNQHGINANAEQQMPFQPFGYNANNYVNYEQQPQQINQQGQQMLTQNFFDTNQNNNNNNNNGKSDEWGDWGDWNENNINMENNNQQKPQQQQQQQQQQPALFNTQPPQQQQQQSASNIINESFSTNDNHWNWNMNMNTEQPIATTTVSSTPTPLTTTTTNLTTSAVLPSPPAMQAQQQQVQRHISNIQQPPAQILDRTNESALQNIAQENNAENVSAFTKPTTTAAATATTNNNNIPNTVFVTQAKPVTMPSRQYASTPNEVSTVASNVEQIIPPPPEGFQNEAPKPPPPPPQQQQGMPMVAPPPPMQAAGFALPPTTGMKSTVNPFKRAGAPQHHVANFITRQPPMATERPTVPLVFEQPDNSEVLHENQEVVNQSYAAVPPQQQQQQIQKQQHLNDERNQYLQTSHLSENAIEENVEADSLPPPGLSRLVLGEPELEANQRQVTGTEDALPDLVGNMRLDERQADGEDNTADSLLPASSAVVVDNMQIAADRNLYLVPGQSNGNNDQLPRVLTGLDNAVQIDTPTPTHSMQLQQNQQQQLAQQQQQQQQNQQQHINMPEQREIDLDGENIEDQQQQQQQQQQRNEPPVEGAAAQIAPQIAVNMSLSESKKSTQLNINKEESDIEQRRKHLNKKLSSMDRYNSDEESDDADYSSDKNRERKLNYRHKNDYREGSVRSEAERERERNRNRAWDHERERERERDREENNSTMKQRTRRDKRDHESFEKEKPRDKYRSGMESGGTERRSKRYTRYDHDSSLEESNHKERSGRHKKSVKDHQRAREKDVRSDRGYEDANYRYRTSQREEKPRSKHEREEPVRRRARDKLANRGEYEDYSKRESDIEKERAQRYFDPRHAAMYGYPHGGQMTSPYDPYYYYDYMPRYNHPGYNEMMRKYYGTQPIVSTGDMSGVGAASSTAATGPGSDHLTGDGGESLHSGRSSLQQQHERYTHAYLTQANEYQRHYQQLQHQQQQQKQQNVSKHYSNMTYDDALYNNHYASGQQQMRAAHSTSNLSVTHSEISRSGLPLEGHAYYPNITLPTTMMANKYQQREASEYADSRFGEDSVRDAEVLPDPQRLTPCKFVNEHTVASLSAGVLVTVKPKYTTHGHSCNIVKVQRLGANDATHKLLQAFPGPLIRGQTHKKTIIEFCEEQIRQGPHHTTIFAKQLVNNDIEKYRPSYTLMWNLLILLLRQNGMVVGTDIAELLLKNKNEFPYDIKQESVDTVSESEDSVEKENEQVEPQNHSEDNGMSLSQSLNETEVTDKFRQYLLYGNVNEALDWAADNNLWGHALFLASKMDRRTHANVMMKFANKLSLNDPLQTLYQLMSGRTPSSVTSVQDEKWGDWRPHLSMILSNTSQKPELDRKAITTLGDSLFNRGDLYAAHFCYLMAQVGFGRYQESATHETTLQQHLPRLVLLGSSHYKSFRDFATNESIIMTEIYEYACSLNDDKFSLIEFQPYKYLYATRLLDYGHHLKTLMYMEQIALHIEKHANKYESSFINKVFELADRLKYYDPVVDKAVDDQHMEGVESPINESTQEFEDQKWLQNLRSLTLRERENNSNLSAAESTNHQQYTTNMIDEFVDINRQITELNNQYTGLNENPLQQQQQQPPIVEQQQPELYANNTQQMYAPTDISQQPELNYQPQQATQNAYYNPIQHQYDQQQPQLTDGGATQNPYDYWAQQPPQQQQHSYMPEENAVPSISLPKSKSYDTDDENQESRNQKQRSAPTQQQSKSNEANKEQTKQNKNNKENKSSQSATQNSGWFGGIWNKLSMKPKNQMILPDDKNPTIVWDAERKRWVNTDGDETAEESFKPPPKLGDMMMPPQQMQQQQQHQPMQTLQQQPPPQTGVVNPIPSVAPTTAPLMQPTAAPAQPAPSKTPTLQSNMFKMQRNRTLKNSYVDVFNPSGAPISNPAENIMAPMLPATTVPTTGFFNPNESAIPATQEATNYQQQQPQQQEYAPQFYNPNQFGGNAGAGY